MVARMLQVRPNENHALVLSEYAGVCWSTNQCKVHVGTMHVTCDSVRVGSVTTTLELRWSFLFGAKAIRNSVSVSCSFMHLKWQHLHLWSIASHILYYKPPAAQSDYAGAV
jgi:hypothetical protein